MSVEFIEKRSRKGRENERETGVGERQRPVCLGGREKEIRTLKDLLKGPLHLCSQGTACHAQRGDCASFPRGAWILTDDGRNFLGITVKRIKQPSSSGE